MSESKVPFPLLDAILLEPAEGKSGHVGVATNTSAPGQVLNEIDPALRSVTSVYGSLIVSMNGTERMVVNSLVHPTLSQIVLVGTESSSFRPSSNLLQALQHGIRPDDGNRINNGVGVSAMYPNLTEGVFGAFRDNITVLPAYMSDSPGSREIVANYLEWLDGRIEPESLAMLREINADKKIYFDRLNQLLARIGGPATREKVTVSLDAKDFQALQPPVVELKPGIFKPSVNFRVWKSEGKVAVDLPIMSPDGLEKLLYIENDDEFTLGYALNRHLGEDRDLISAQEQLLLGAEVAKVVAQISNGITSERLIGPITLAEREVVTIPNSVKLKTDSQYYYMVGLKDGQISVSCMAHDNCTEMFELRSPSVNALLERIAADNRFEAYELDFLHRYYLGAEIARAGIALEHGMEYMQDFPHLFRLNTDELPLVVSEADTFLAAHIGLLRRIYTEGLTEPHGDEHKGLARSAGALAIFRTAEAFQHMPRIYSQGSQTAEELRAAYMEELLRTEHDGSYNYGHRTRSYFGFDQLEAAMDSLGDEPERAAIIQRYDPAADMSLETDPETGKQVSSHDPCLTHDIYFVAGGHLHALHLARAHNAVNAYPQNLYGLHDAYDMKVAEHSGALPFGDTYMLSSRANILLLTEEQRTKKLLAEPFKPMDTDRNRSGPYRLGPDIPLPPKDGGLAYGVFNIEEVRDRPECQFLQKIENYKGINTLERAVNYLRKKGSRHNNPVLSSYLAGEEDPTTGHLVFFQANVMGGKLQVTAVYSNRHLDRIEDDQRLANYLATRFADELQVPLGKLSFFTVGYKK